MKPIDKRFQFEEQILMKREVAAIKMRMNQFVEHARSFRAHPVESPAMHMQMVQMAQQVQMIRQRCYHIWEAEYVVVDGEVKNVEQICVICEARQPLSSS